MSTYITTEDDYRLITESGEALITETGSSTMSKRYQIIDEVIEIMKSITTDNDYSTNVAYVSDKMQLKHPEELDKNRFPAVFVMDDNEEKEALSFFSETGEDMKSTLTVLIVGIVFSRSGETREARTNMLRDIEKAIVSDETLNAMLIEAPSPLSVETDQGYFGNYSVFRQKFELQYIYNHLNGG